VSARDEYYETIASRLYTSVVADVMDALGATRQVMHHAIQPVYAGARVVGRAATMLAAEVYEVPAEPFQRELELLDSLRPGEVVVCATPGSVRAAIWGELLSTHAQARGGRGAIIDGLTRDSRRITELRFPVFARGRTPADSLGRLDVVATRVPIEVGGAPCRDGDLVFGDEDGCVVVPAEIEDTVIEQALAKVSGENTVREALRAGARIQDVFREHGIL
jgi:regulator of RNase E activity RraA